MEKEYIVTLHKGVDPIAFRQDMIADNMLPYVPTKAVTVANERPASVRNTHYMLTDQEAVELCNDRRVQAVEIRPDLRDDIGIARNTTQVGDFNKSTLTSGANINWGLRRISALANPYNTSGVAVGGYTHTLTGTGVDFIVQDSGIQADHPEFQDSFGISRVQQIDWYQAQPTVAGTLPDGFYTDYDGHGTHCAGIAAGKTYGWAKGSNIYSIKIAGLQGTSDPNSGMPMSDIFDVIKEWHLRKKDSNYTPTNATYTPSEGIMTMTIGLHSFVVGDKIRIAPYGIKFRCAKDNFETTHSYPRGEGVPNETGTDPFYEKEIAITAVSSNTITVNIGISSDTTVHRFDSASVNAIIVPGVTRKRPTVVNMSWGYFSRYLGITGGRYRGVDWTGSSKVSSYGMTGAFDGVGYRHPIRIASVDADVEELIEAGVTVCIAAGNGYHKIATASDPDYDNYYTGFGTNKYYHRGSSPYSTNAIMVGNIDSALDADGKEQVARSSEKGPGVDVYAPGTNIFSATSTSNRFTDGQYGDTSFRIANISGTSMAAPQIAGLVTTYGEILPETTPAKYKAWVVGNAKEQLNDNGNSGTDYSNYRSLMGGQNAYAFQPYNDANVLTIAGDETLVEAIGAVEATYSLSANVTSVNEGESFTITLLTTGLVNGSIVPYAITGVTSADIGDVNLTGTFIVGTSTVLNFTATEDNTFDDGNETFTLALTDIADKSIAVQIVDSSKPDPVYSLATTRQDIGEGETFTITLTATNVLSGTIIPYTITGIESADISGEPLTGNLTVGTDIARTYVITADGLLEGSETLQFSAAGQTVSVSINDTSNSPITYNLVASTATLNEGDDFYVDLVIENGIPNVTYPYAITGISASDLSTGALTGNFISGSVNRQSFTVSEDFTTEGTETLVISLTSIDNVTASIEIADTSTTLVAGDAVVSTPGAGTFTVPVGVTSVSIMAIGAGAGSGTSGSLGAGQVTGGGGSGAVGILNNLSVTPGQVISYDVGSKGTGNNDGGDTTVTYSGVTYTAGGGEASPPTSLAGLAVHQLKAGGAGGTTTGAWTISKAGGVGGKSFRYQTGGAVVGGGAGGSGAGSIGGNGYPTDILDYNNAVTSPYNWTTRTSGNIFLSNASYASSNMRFTVDVAAGGTENYNDEYAYLLKRKIEQVLAGSGSWDSYDAYYILLRSGTDAPKWVWKGLTSDFGSTVTTTIGSGGNTQYQFGAGGGAIQTTTVYQSVAFARDASYTSNEQITVLEIRGGVATDASDLNTTLITDVKLYAEGDTASKPQQTGGSGGGHGFVTNWQSGTGITFGAIGGGSTLTKALTGLRGGLSTASSQTLSVPGAGVTVTGVAGEKGNNVSTVTPAATNYECGAGAGGVLVMGLATSGGQTRSESGQDGGLWIMYPGSRDQFEAPQYTVASNKDNVNEGSTFTINVTNNLSTTDPQLLIPFEITGISSGDIDMTGLVTTYGNIRGTFTQVANNKTFSVTADNAFDGSETFNLGLIESLTATTQLDPNHYLPFMTNNSQSKSVIFNDSSDGTQTTYPGVVTNSGASGYLWNSGSDRNGSISGLNPYISINKGDTISWDINATGHPFYIKDVQGNGTANQTGNVVNQGTQTDVVQYTPTVGGRKYYQCSIHTDMNGEIYISDKHWATTHFARQLGDSGNKSFDFVAHGGSGNSIVIRRSKTASDYSVIYKYTKHGSAVWFRDYAPGYNVNSVIVDASENAFIGYSGSWNWETNTPSANYPSDAYITKVNASGTVQWQRSYEDSDGYGLGIKAMAFADDGNIIAVGGSYLQSLNSGFWMIKVDVTNGDVISLRRTTPTDKKSEASFVSVDSNGNIYVYGSEIRPGSDTELQTRLWKFNSSLTEQWQTGWYVPAATGTGFNPAGLTLDQNDNPIIGLGHVDSPQSGFEQSHILKINPADGTITIDWALNDIGTVDALSDYRQSNPQLKDLTFDSRNNKIIAVGTQNKDSTNSNKRGMVITFSEDLSDLKFRNVHTSASSNLNVEINSCSLDNTLNPNDRLWVAGSAIPSSQTGIGSIGALIASVPINEADTGTATIQVEDWTYEIHGSVSIDTNSPLTVQNVGGVIDDAIGNAGALVHGTTSTNLQNFTDYQMVLDTSLQVEPEISLPTYSLSSSSASINEGQSFTITLDTENVANGTNVAYTITGIQSADIGGASLSGILTVQSNSAQITYNVTADTTTEGAETFTFTLDASSTSIDVTINDTSQSS